MSSAADLPASQFYTGLVAELYEPLAGDLPRSDDYVAFLEKSGTPALELACGSGVPMLDLLERGYAVEGLDASADMLERCRRAGAARGLEPTLHLADMASFALGRRYRSIFLAGASFSLLTTDAEAARALANIRDHLEAGGGALIPLTCESGEQMAARVGRVQETTTPAGEKLRVCATAFALSDDGRDATWRLRYERTNADGRIDALERDWHRRSWTQDQFRTLVVDAGLEPPHFVAPEGGAATADAPVFIALTRRP